MTTALQPAIAPRLGRRAAAAPLRAVEPAARRRPKLFYGVVAVAGAILIAGAQMVVSIMTTQTTYQLSSLTEQQRELTWQKQILSDQITGLSSPQYLAANATALGMVIDESPSYLRLSDAAVLGSGQASTGASSVDALGRGLVANHLVAQTPLVTDPQVSMQTPTPAPPETAPADPSGAEQPDAATPPPLTDGLPSPRTH